MDGAKAYVKSAKAAMGVATPSPRPPDLQSCFSRKKPARARMSWRSGLWADLSSFSKARLPISAQPQKSSPISPLNNILATACEADQTSHLIYRATAFESLTCAPPRASIGPKTDWTPLYTYNKKHALLAVDNPLLNSSDGFSSVNAATTRILRVRTGFSTLHLTSWSNTSDTGWRPLSTCGNRDLYPSELFTSMVFFVDDRTSKTGPLAPPT